MTKHVVAAVLPAAVLAVPKAASQSLPQKSGWQPQDLREFPADAAGPLDSKPKPSKPDLPIGWQGNRAALCDAGASTVGNRGFGIAEDVTMNAQKRIKLDDLRQPGMRRIHDAMKQIKREAPSLIEEALIASIELAKRQNGGRLPQ